MTPNELMQYEWLCSLCSIIVIALMTALWREDDADEVRRIPIKFNPA
jgi:hypothetical protein